MQPINCTNCGNQLRWVQSILGSYWTHAFNNQQDCVGPKGYSTGFMAEPYEGEDEDEV